MPVYDVVVRISVTAPTQGEALHAIETRVTARGVPAGLNVPARVVETISVKEA